MTELLYLRDAYRRDMDTTVVSVDSESRGAELAETVFYVTGGGQPHDTGSLRWEGGAARVVDVRRIAGVVRHVLADGDDIVNIGDGWTDQGTVDIDGETFRVLESNGVMLQVDPKSPLPFSSPGPGKFVE